jgi:hypothetical protein
MKSNTSVESMMKFLLQFLESLFASVLLITVVAGALMLVFDAAMFLFDFFSTEEIFSNWDT